ncbi:MAG: hypothetical protein DWQ04_15960 [Chloroflexi bacterium]|nr:MAG: hypothetical protein DWQ04_15960 [Chloroflexota bacterium]
MTDENRIVVRDRRSVHQFSIHNRVVDEWFPIITARGFALYSMYCRMASKEEERCYPGYRLIAKHMGMGISTISDYNKLLVWCGLLHIEPGDRNSPNDYYILDIPEVTEDLLARIRKLAGKDVTRLEQEREEEAQKLDAAGMKKDAAKLRQKRVGTFYSGLLKRLDKWEPIYVHWGEEKERPFVIKSGQLSLFPGDPVGEHPNNGQVGDPDGEHPDLNGNYRNLGGKQGDSDGEHTKNGSIRASGGEHGVPDSEQGDPGSEHRVPSSERGDPVGEHLAPHRERGDPVGEHPDPTGEGGDPGGEHPDPVRERGDPGSGSEQSTTTIQSNNPKQQSTTTATTRESPQKFTVAFAAPTDGEIQAQILDWMGFNGRLLPEEQGQVTNALLLAWAWWVKLEANTLMKRGKNAVGIARAGWRRGDAPGSGLVEFAEMWLKLDASKRLDLLEDADSARFRVNNRLYEAEGMGLSDTSRRGFYRLWVVTEGVIAPPMLMPEDDEEEYDVE